MMHEILIEEKLRETLGWLYKKDRKRYEICMKKIEEIVGDPEHYKPLRYDMKNIRRVHIAKSFVLTFKIVVLFVFLTWSTMTRYTDDENSFATNYNFLIVFAIEVLPGVE